MDCPTNTPLARKLGIKAGHRLALLEEPAGFCRLLGELPEENTDAVCPADLPHTGRVCYAE